MKLQKSTTIICIILILPQISLLGIAQTVDQYSTVYKHDEISKNNSPHLFELFTEDVCNKCTTLENEYVNLIEDNSESSIWLTWHRATNNPSIDINLRMEQLEISNLPEIAINYQKTNSTNLSGEDVQDKLSNNLDKNNMQSIIDLPLEISMLDSNQDTLIDSVMVSSKITPHTNLSNDTTIHVILVEWRSILNYNDQEILKRNLVKDWVPKKDFAVEGNISTNWSFTFTPEYLDAAGVLLEQEMNERYGIILFVTGNERNNSDTVHEILAANMGKLPNAAQSASSEQSLSWVFFTILVTLALLLIVISERKREYGIPKLSGKIIEINEKGISAIMKIKVGNLPLEIKSIDVGDKWALKTKSLNKSLIAGEELELNLNLRRRKKDVEDLMEDGNPTLRVSIEIEQLGGWVLNLPLKE